MVVHRVRIKDRLILLGSVFTLLLVLSFVLMFLNYYHQQQLHMEFVTKTKNINDVLVILGEMQNTLHAYRKDMSKSTYTAYQSQMKQLDAAIATYISSGEHEKDSLNQMQFLSWLQD